MKQNYGKISRRLCLMGVLAILSGAALPVEAVNGSAEQGVVQQDVSITGRVVDEQGEPLIGATVVVVGSESRSTITQSDGSYKVSVPKNGETLIFSYMGFESQRVAIGGRSIIDITMKSMAVNVGEVVVVGYGTQRKSDLTGSVATVGSKDFNKGMVGSAEQLINGKIAGVQIVSNGGSPSAGSTIRIRGGASLNASNDPLIVLDGVPLETGGISGNSSNFLSMINPADIESMTVLKDASSTAIYGSRASNGVIMITTKKGSSTTQITVSTTHSLQQRTRVADMLSADEYREVINAHGNTAQKALLGNTSTDWNNEIFQLAYGTDNNVSISGSVAKVLPVRFSAGYNVQNGILKTDRTDRITGSLSITPSLLNEHLKLSLNVKGTMSNNRFANAGAIYSASAYNPTIDVHSGNDDFGGYNEAIDNTGTPSISGQVMNPVGLINLNESLSDVNRLVGNFDADYRIHLIPELRAHVTLGYDKAKGKGTVYIPQYAAQNYTSGGRDYEYGPQQKSNQLLTFYLNYNKEFSNIRSRIDLTAGYDYQKWVSKTPLFSQKNVAGVIQSTSAASDQRHVLLSYYGRLNYTFADKYLLTATVRRDGSSRFSKENRWSMFPSVALAWRISEEQFIKDLGVFDNLKLRASYGETGQQDGIGNYGYMPIYTIGQQGAQYLFGNTYYNTYRPESYVADLKWESTQSYNVGLDFGFFKNRLSGSVDYYNRKTKDLLATVPSPAGVNFGKIITTNVGNMKSDGFELTLNATPVDTPDWTWDLSYNMTWQNVKITNLSLVEGAESTFTYTGQAFGDTFLQIMKEGYSPYTFYVYKQVYTQAGKPIEGMYADLDGDRQINTNDLYCAGSPNPDYLMGLSSQLRYKKLTLGFALRGSIGGKVYNGTSMNMGALGTISWNPYQINNLSSSYLSTGFNNRQFLSDYYIEDGSFMKMDNISLSYNFGKVTPWAKLRVSGVVQNVFTISKYSGVDPEISYGIESSFYPRARIYSLSVGIDF